MPQSLLYIETQFGQPVLAGNTQLTPASRSFRLQPGRLPVAIIWNRPLFVRAEMPDGESWEIPIRDHTRILQVLILASGLVGSLVIWLLARKRHQTQN